MAAFVLVGATLAFSEVSVAGQGDGSAFAVDVNMTLLGGTPVVTGPLAPSSTDGPTSAALASITVPGVLSTGVVATEATTDAGGIVHASSLLNNVNITIAPIGLITSVQATCDGSTATTTIQGAVIDGIPVPTNPTANYTVSSPPGPIPPPLFTVVFNEQITNPDGSLTVNAMRVTVNGLLGTGGFTLGQANCGPDLIPVDGDGDGIYDGADNCPEISNPLQGDRDLDDVGDVCDANPDGGVGLSYAVDAELTLLGSPAVDVGPLGASSTAGPTSSALAAINVPDVVQTGVALTEATTDPDGEVHTSALVNDVNVLLADLGSITSIQTTCDSTTSANTGSATIQDGVIDGIPVPTNPPPNYTVSSPPGPIPPPLVNITFNHQVQNPDGSLSVTGMRVTLNALLGTGGFTIGHARCLADDPPDTDTDSDGVFDSVDNCPADPNAGQENLDGDAQGDVCDPFPADPLNVSGEVDGDGVLDNVDNCIGIRNPGQDDEDNDGIGNMCDVNPLGLNDFVDADFDIIPDPQDNCPFDANTLQANADGDAVGDACDPLPNDPKNAGDTDEDGSPDVDDNCVLVPNPDQLDDDSEGIGDACDIDPQDPTNNLDDDGDSVLDAADNCPQVFNDGQLNFDGDSEGDACDADDDNDGLLDVDDPNPLDPSDGDTDGDGLLNPVDPDDDNDGVLDGDDAFPLDATESVDSDGDGTGNNADTDDDGDGANDAVDAFPLDPTESVDTDSDGVGNNTDTDDDDDGVSDARMHSRWTTPSRSTPMATARGTTPTRMTTVTA